MLSIRIIPIILGNLWTSGDDRPAWGWISVPYRTVYGIECTVPMVEPGHMVYGVRTWLNCFVRSPEIRGTFISFSIRVQFSVSVPFFFFPPLVQSRQFRNSYWPAYQNSPSGNIPLLAVAHHFFLFYLLSFHIFPMDSGRPTEDISPIRGFCLSGTGRTAVD